MQNLICVQKVSIFRIRQVADTNRGCSPFLVPRAVFVQQSVVTNGSQLCNDAKNQALIARFTRRRGNMRWGYPMGSLALFL